MEARPKFLFALLNDIRIIDYSRTLRICKEWDEEEKATIRGLVAWRNKEWARVIAKSSSPSSLLFALASTI
jgi:hypothetical protein